MAVAKAEVAAVAKSAMAARAGAFAATVPGWSLSAPPLVTGHDYFDGVARHRRALAVRSICDEFEDALRDEEYGCVVLVHPTPLTDRLRAFFEKEKHVQRCLDVLLAIGLDPAAMFVEGLTKTVLEEEEEDEGDADDDDDDDELSESDEEEEEADDQHHRHRRLLHRSRRRGNRHADDGVERRLLRRVDAIQDTLAKEAIPKLEKFFRDALTEIVKYGWTPVGHDDNDARRTPRVPLDYVVVRLQPSGDYVCRDLDGRDYPLHFFRRPTAKEDPSSDLALLLPDFENMETLREEHLRAMKSASRPFVISSKAPDDLLWGATPPSSSSSSWSARTANNNNGGGGGGTGGRDPSLNVLRDGRAQDLASLFRSEAASTTRDGDTLAGELAEGAPMRQSVQRLYRHLLREKVENWKKRRLDRRTIDLLERKLQRVVTDDDPTNGPLRYELPEGVQHVASNLGIRPNAFGYETQKRLWQVEIEQVMLASRSGVDVGAADTRQGVGRTLTASVEASGSHASNKIALLQKFFLDELLREWLREQRLPMAATATATTATTATTTSAGGIVRGSGEGGGGNGGRGGSGGSLEADLRFYGTILKPLGLALWLKRSTGFRAAEIDLRGIKRHVRAAAASLDAAAAASTEEVDKSKKQRR